LFLRGEKLFEGVIEKVFQYDLVFRTSDGKRILIFKHAVDVIEPVE